VPAATFVSATTSEFVDVLAPATVTVLDPAFNIFIVKVCAVAVVSSETLIFKFSTLDRVNTDSVELALTAAAMVSVSDPPSPESESPAVNVASVAEKVSSPEPPVKPEPVSVAVVRV
jgi:hypothetical protein